ncbi:hypothetical protein [Mesobacillus thioparans]|uniref:hypothetical protein n=1 Tax=Mesobacillus thioparans TaxID=370439 RepID=UPI0039EF5FC6
MNRVGQVLEHTCPYLVLSQSQPAAQPAAQPALTTSFLLDKALLHFKDYDWWIATPGTYNT